MACGWSSIPMIIGRHMYMSSEMVTKQFTNSTFRLMERSCARTTGFLAAIYPTSKTVLMQNVVALAEAWESIHGSD